MLGEFRLYENKKHPQRQNAGKVARKGVALHTVCTVRPMLAGRPQKWVLGVTRSIGRVEKEAAPNMGAPSQFQGAHEV